MVGIATVRGWWSEDNLWCCLTLHLETVPLLGTMACARLASPLAFNNFPITISNPQSAWDDRYLRYCAWLVLGFQRPKCRSSSLFCEHFTIEPSPQTLRDQFHTVLVLAQTCCLSK